MRLYRIAERHPDVIVKLNSLGETMKPKRERQRSSRVGSDNDFISFIHDWGHPEWVVLAVEAPIDKVSGLYARICSAREWLTELPVRAPRKKDNEIAPLVTIVQPKESNWTVILHTLFDMSDITDAEKVWSGLLTPCCLIFAFAPRRSLRRRRVLDFRPHPSPDLIRSNPTQFEVRY